MKKKLFLILGAAFLAAIVTFNVSLSIDNNTVASVLSIENIEVLANGETWNGCGTCATEWTTNYDKCTETNSCGCVNGNGIYCLSGTIYVDYCGGGSYDSCTEYGCGHG